MLVTDKRLAHKSSIMAWVLALILSGCFFREVNSDSNATAESGWTADLKTRLINELFADYETDILPRCEDSTDHKVTVTLDMSLRGILDVYEPSQLLTATLWQRWRWRDCRLRWNSSEYEGLDKMIVSASRVWKPDAVIFDSVADFQSDTISNTVVMMYPDGEVYLVAPGIIKITCNIDTTYFPLDRQICRVTYVSSSYSMDQLDLVNKNDSGDITLYVDNGEWDLLGIPCRRHEVKYPCCAERFSDVSYYIVMQRQPLYYIFNLVMPCLLITGISLLLFYLPPDSGEKISMGITVLLSLCVFLLMVSEKMPSTSDTVPLIAQYFGATIIMVSLSCVMTVVVLHIHHKGAHGRRVPRWLRTLVLDWLGRICCMRLDIYDKGSMGSSRSQQSVADQCHVGKDNIDLLVKDHRTFLDEAGPKCYTLGVTSQNEYKLVSLVQKQLTSLETIGSMLEEEREGMQVEAEWKKVAMVIDRVLLIACCVVNLGVSSIIVFLNAPDYDLQTAEFTI